MISAEQVAALIAEMKMPALGVYGGDWMRDPVASTALGPQGLWFRMMLVMHDAKPYGHLVGANGLPLNQKAIARQCGCSSVGELRRYLAELDGVGVPGRTGDAAYAGIFRGDIEGEEIDLSPLRIAADGVIYSRRMIRDQRLRVIRRLTKVHKPNGNLTGQKPERRAPAISSSLSLSSSDSQEETPSLPSRSRSRRSPVNLDDNFRPLWSHNQFRFKADKIAQWINSAMLKEKIGPGDEDFDAGFQLAHGMGYDYWLEQRDLHEQHFRRGAA